MAFKKGKKPPPPKTDVTREKQTVPPKSRAQHLKDGGFLWGKGQSGNPAGRPIGSRTKFSETFVKDFLQDWEENGLVALQKCRQVDPAAYVRVAASLLPKDFNVNVKGDEAALEKLLETFNDEELHAVIAGLAAAGKSSAKGKAAPQAGTKPDKLH